MFVFNFYASRAFTTILRDFPEDTSVKYSYLRELRALVTLKSSQEPWRAG
jgi:hypothetical protein